jgi:hypothetical protein
MRVGSLYARRSRAEARVTAVEEDGAMSERPEQLERLDAILGSARIAHEMSFELSRLATSSRQPALKIHRP